MIRNIEFPSCKNCKHFTPSINRDFVSEFGKCNKFGNKDIISDKITYDYVDSCGKDTYKCGEEGKYFEKEKNINLKMIKHAIISKLPYLIFAIIILSPTYIKTIIG